MTNVEELHPMAMDLAESAFLCRDRGELDKARDLFLRALDLERQAALLLPLSNESEPSRSVLCYSAASLAYNAGLYEDADWLIANGLAGFPQPETRERLKRLYNEVNLRLQVNSSDTTRDEDSQKIPSPAKLEALSIASDEMMQSIFSRDSQTTLRTVVRHAQKLLEAEACAIFLVADDDRKQLQMKATYTDKAGDQFEPVNLVIQTTPQGGLTGYIADRGDIVALRSADLRDNPYVAGRKTEHLVSGQCYSSLGVPIQDRDKRLLGLIKVDNKKGPEGIAGDDFFFSEEDISIAKILANNIAVVLENLHTFATFRGLVSNMQSARSNAEVLQAVLREGVGLLRGNRGDLALWDAGRNDLVVKFRFGEGGIAEGEPLPEQSIIRQVWNTGCPQLILDVAQEPNYFSGHEKTKSEIVVRLEWEGQQIGVINIESFHESFGNHDIELLRLLSQYAVIALRAVGREAHFRGVMQGLGVTSAPDFLTSILESVRDVCGFDGGVIFIADYASRKLSCEAFVSKKPLDLANPREFSYLFDETSLATEVFRTRAGHFDLDAWKSLIANRHGLLKFKIEGSIVGMPLIFGEKVVGVLVAWSDARGALSQGGDLAKELEAALEPFARLAAAAIAISDIDSQRTNALEAVKEILRRMQTTSPKEELVRLILEGLQRVGFERARIFEFQDNPPQFVVIDSLGVDDPGGLRGHRIFINENLYAKRTADDALVNPVARVYDPTGPDGPDPDAENVGKPADLPWAVVPLVVSGKFYGQVVADNAATRRPITGDMLQYLTLLGALAAHVIQSAQTNQVLHALASPILVNGPLGSQLKVTIIKRLLVFLTAGETLGFNRALFFELDEEHGELTYMSGLGSVTRERFAQVGQQARQEGMTKIFDRAGELDDSELDVRMHDYRINANDLTARALLNSSSFGEFSPSDIGIWPDWMREIAARIDATHVLIAPVRIENQTFGFILVDRRWGPSLVEADQAALMTSANLAALILRQHTLQRYINLRLSVAESSFLRLQERTLTICFWDIRGFTDLSEKLKHKPYLVSGFLKDYYNAAAEIIEAKHNGVVDKFIGDGVMALFGLLEPQEYKDDGASDAVFAALELRKKFAEVVDHWKTAWELNMEAKVPDIKLGCGINTGQTLVGNVGTDTRDVFTAFGPSVNFASRIEGRSKTGEILISQTTRGRVFSKVACVDAGVLDDIKGLHGSYLIFSVEPESA